MVKKTVVVEVKTKGNKGVDKTLDGIKKDLKDINKQAEKTFSGEHLKDFQKESVKTGDAVKSVKTRLRELEDEMADIGDVGSPQFQKLAKEAGVLKDKVNNAKSATKAMSADFPKLQLGVQAFQAMGAGAQVAIGASQLLGEENEEITKGIQKMMAIQSILNGVNTIANALSDETALGLKIRTIRTNILTATQARNAGATGAMTIAQKGLTIAQMTGAGAMKVLNFVMSLNPVFILIAAFALLAGAMAFFSSSSDTAKEDSEALNASMDKQADAMKRLQALSAKVHSNRMRELAIQDATEKEVHEAKLERLAQEEKERVNEIKALSNGYDAQKRLYKKALKEKDSETAKSIKDRIKADKKRIAELKLNADEFNIARQEQEKAHNKFLADEAEKQKVKDEKILSDKIKTYKSYLKNRLSARRQIEDLHDQIEGDEITRNNLKYERLTADTLSNETLIQSEKEALIKSYETLRKSTEDSIIKARRAKEQEEITKSDEAEAKRLQDEFNRQDEQFKLLQELTSTDRELKIQAIVADYEAKFLLAEGNAVLERELELAQSEELNALRDADAVREEERQRKSFDNKVQIAQDYASSVNGLAQDIFAIADNIGKQDDASKEKRARRQFNINKILQSGMAVVSGIQAVQNTFATASASPITAVNPAYPFIQAGIAGTVSAVNVAKIATSSYGGGGGGSISAPSSGGGSGGSAVSQPAQFNIIGSSGNNQLAESLGNQPPVQAFVVGSEVTTQQSLDRNKVDTASL